MGCHTCGWVAVSLGVEPRLYGLTVRCTAIMLGDTEWIKGYEPLIHFWFLGCAVLLEDHFTLFAQYAADMGPLLMLLAWRDWNALRCPAVWFVLTPCCPNLMVLTCPPLRATTMWDFVGWLGVALGLLNPVTPARASRGSGFAGMLFSFDGGFAFPHSASCCLV